MTPGASVEPVSAISSMATREVLSELAAAYRSFSGRSLNVESVGGVDAAKRVSSGESFDLVILSRDAIDMLAVSGHVTAGTTVDLMRSGVAVAVAAGAPRPPIDTEEAVRRAVLLARTIGYSTGPSGRQLARLFQRWNIADAVRERIVIPPAGIAVGTLIARGDVELGFQQLSELIHVPGVDVIGPLPASVQIETTFSGAVCSRARHAGAARSALAFLGSPAAADAKRRQGMEPVADAPDGGAP